MTSNTDELILVALNSGDALAAEQLCCRRLEQEPDASAVLVLLAVSLWRQHRQDEALVIYARLTQLNPGDSVHWRNYATALRESGDPAAAEDAFATAVRLAPDDAELLEQHGLLQMELGKPSEARNTLLRAFGKSPDSPAIRIHAALACTACRDLRADNLLRPWRDWLPLEESLQSELAEALAQQSEVEAAIELLEDLTRRLPAERRIRLRLAALYERVNRLDEAETLLENAVTEGARAGADSREASEIVRQRARLAERKREYEVARTILERSGPCDDRGYAHWFALAHVCDKIGDTAAAMAALERAHALQIEAIKSTNPHWFGPNSEILPNQNKRVTESDYAEWPAMRVPDASQSPVFVVGFPRSGTTLLEQMLDAHPQLQSMDERPFFNMLATQLENSTGFQIPSDLGRLNQRDCDELRKGYLILACGKVPRRWNTQLVDKNPLNMLWLPMIYRLFPAAKFIFALRHPCDVLLSNYMQNFMSTTLGAACASLETLANTYVDAMRQWLYHVELFKPEVFVSRYEELVADPVQQTARIAEHLGLEDAGRMLDFDRHARGKGFIATPSYTQVIEPINRKGIARWQRYREYFEPVLPILAPMLEHWHYTVDSPAALAED